MTSPGPTIKPTRPWVLALASGATALLSALALGLWQDHGGSLPIPGWMSWAGVGLLAAGVGWTARATRRALARDPGALDPQTAVSRLVLGKTSRLAGALVLGGYAALAVMAAQAWPAPLAVARVVHAGVTVLACVAWMAAGRALERACRISGHDESDGDASTGFEDGSLN